MTLTDRLTVFFLAALGAVLLAFDVALYFLVEGQLLRRIDERAEAALDALVAAAEQEPEGYDWDSQHRTILTARGPESPRWAVLDPAGTRIDGDADSAPLPTESSREWKVARRKLVHPNGDGSNPPPPGEHRYPGLEFAVAVPRNSVNETLEALLWSLVGVTVGVGLIAGLAVRRICRRALSPVTRMAEAADRLAADELEERLPVPEPNDELRLLAESFNDLLSRVREAYERQKSFTSEASHQLRTPLTALRGQLEVALRRDRDSEEYRRVLATGILQADRLKKIVEALLFLARADREARLPGLEVIDLANWLPTHLKASWSDHPRFADLSISESDQKRLIRVDPHLLGQAADNLVENAFKYTPPGSAVRVESRQIEDEVELSVTDRGEGIPPDERESVFEPFFRSASARRLGVAGVGLGLSVTARIATAFGGRVAVASEVGAGCRFAMTFPAHPSTSE